jgi:hypothetical protein
VDLTLASSGRHDDYLETSGAIMNAPAKIFRAARGARAPTLPGERGGGDDAASSADCRKQCAVRRRRIPCYFIRITHRSVSIHVAG